MLTTIVLVIVALALLPLAAAVLLRSLEAISDFIDYCIPEFVNKAFAAKPEQEFIPRCSLESLVDECPAAAIAICVLVVFAVTLLIGLLG